MRIQVMSLSALICMSGYSYVDFEETVQDFVLETKQIHVPGYPGAFNASIERWKDRLLLCFRVRDDKMISTFQMGFVWLDEEFNPQGKPTILELLADQSSFSKYQDPRLLVINDKLFIAYSNFIKVDDIVTRRMFIAQVHHEKGRFFIRSPLCLHPFDGASDRWEKNWVPFNYQGTLLIAYSLAPHKVLQPTASGRCNTVSSTSSAYNWDYGELRGGTPALLDGDQYIAFFHSSKKMATTHSQGKEIPHYVMGAYTFNARPPFDITRMSPEPIVGKNFYYGPAYNTWKPLRVVFPMGCIVDENYIWVTYGRQDFEIWVVKLDKKGLYDSLVDCKKNNDEACEIALEDVYECFFENLPEDNS